MSGSRSGSEMKSTMLTTPNDSSFAAGKVALGNGWLAVFGILVADRISCLFVSSGLVDGLQPSTLRKQAISAVYGHFLCVVASRRPIGCR